MSWWVVKPLECTYCDQPHYAIMMRQLWPIGAVQILAVIIVVSLMFRKKP